jgi:hypothetical protein
MTAPSTTLYGRWDRPSPYQNVRMTSGDSRLLTVTVRDDTGVKHDLTGSSIRWQLAPRYGCDIVASKAVGSGVTITSALNGTFTVQLDPADTACLCGEYRHEAEVTDSAGNVATVLSGTVTIRKDIAV